MKIGLFGGSFDPPHKGHLQVAKMALKRLQLDQVWWMVSPGNPLKENGPWPLEKRLYLCKELTKEQPKFVVTGFEACGLGGPSYSAETLDGLQTRYRETDFVWVMGGDNLVNIRYWKNWTQIVENMPVLFVDRPGQRIYLQSTPLFHKYGEYQVSEEDVGLLPMMEAPAWAYISMRLQDISSSQIRADRVNDTASDEND